jgi:DNA primase
LPVSLSPTRIKSYYADQNITKRELAEYYVAAMPRKAGPHRAHFHRLPAQQQGGQRHRPLFYPSAPRRPRRHPPGVGELEKLKNAHPYTLETVLPRLKKDPWKGMEKLRQHLPF